MNKKLILRIGILGSIASIIGLLLYFIPSNQSKQKVNSIENLNIKGNDNQIVQGDNYNVNNQTINIQEKMNLEKDFEIIAREYVGKDAHIEDKIIINRKGYEESFLIIFSELNDQKTLLIDNVENSNGRWRTKWRTRIPANPFGVGSHIITSFRKGVHRFLVYTGCFPHACDNGWGVFMYDISEGKGYTAISNYDNGKFKISFLQGFPKTIVAKNAFQDVIFENIVDLNNLKSNRGRIIDQIPLTAQYLPNILYKINTTRPYIKDLEISSIKQAHLGDLNGDSKLEWLILDHNDNILIIDERTTHRFPSDLLENYNYPGWFTLGIYKNIKEAPYINIGFLQGASGNFGTVIVLQFSNNKYSIIKGSKVLEKMKKEFGIIGALDE